MMYQVRIVLTRDENEVVLIKTLADYKLLADVNTLTYRGEHYGFQRTEWVHGMAEMHFYHVSPPVDVGTLEGA
jgi:hypothetical protein